MDYLEILVEEIHSVTIATVDEDGHPQTRVIDLMLQDGEYVYFLTAKGKEFYRQLTEQGYVALSAVRGKMSISLRGYVKNIGKEKLDEIFTRNPYMQHIYPEGTREPLEVFCLHEAEGSFFDISDPSHIRRESFTLGGMKEKKSGYYIESGCIGCGSCLSLCPQKCIDMTRTPAIIEQSRCLHCGACISICPVNAIVRYAGK